MSLYSEFRKSYPDFYYRKYDIEENGKEIKVSFSFEIPKLASFNPRWVFFKKDSRTFSNDDTFRNLVFSLGMVELISYWKTVCSPNVHILPHGIDDEQKIWWKKLYYGGLGEFFYRNRIEADFDSFMSIYSDAPICVCHDKKSATLSGCLVPVGGGKDSAVTLEILSGESVVPYVINSRGATDDICRVAGFSKDGTDMVLRYLDRKILDLNEKGFLNGHTPFSAIVAFSALIDAYISGKKYIVLSNESSANESTVNGSDVNHQFSKGYEFEKEFRRYEKKYFNTGISYFSLLRPLSEFQIAFLFSKYKKYHAFFKSCNAGSKKDIWCCDCPKCLFVYIILSPFLEECDLVKIFNENLLNKENLLSDFQKLTGIASEKPFECVGSRDEVRCAVTLTSQKYLREGKELPWLLKYYADCCDMEKNPEKYYDFYDSENFLPEHFEKLLKGELNVSENN